MSQMRPEIRDYFASRRSEMSTESRRRWERSAAQAECDRFNASYPVGTPVEFWTWLREGPGKRGETSSEARLSLGGTPVVWALAEAAEEDE